MNSNKAGLVKVDYDFDFIKSLSSLTETTFNNIKSADFEKFQDITCRDYGVPPTFELSFFKTEDIAEEISNETGWLVLGYEIIKS